MKTRSVKNCDFCKINNFRFWTPIAVVVPGRPKEKNTFGLGHKLGGGGLGASGESATFSIVQGATKWTPKIISLNENIFFCTRNFKLLIHDEDKVSEKL